MRKNEKPQHIQVLKLQTLICPNYKRIWKHCWSIYILHFYWRRNDGVIVLCYAEYLRCVAIRVFKTNMASTTVLTVSFYITFTMFHQGISRFFLFSQVQMSWYRQNCISPLKHTRPYSIIVKLFLSSNKKNLKNVFNIFTPRFDFSCTFTKKVV